MSLIFYNDTLVAATTPLLEAGNRLSQYGDGLFETMRVCNGRLVLADYHFDRLFGGMQALMLSTPPYFTRGYLQDAILQLCTQNGHLTGGRVRLTVFRNQGAAGNPQDQHANQNRQASNLPGAGRQHSTPAGSDQPAVIIESWPVDNTYIFRNDPFIMDVYPGARKSADALAAFKTAAYLPYALAAVFARRQHLHDCLVLNSSGNVCDASIANIFLVKDRALYTPPISEGCINGVMRRHLISNIDETTLAVIEAPLNVEMLLSADEVFLTNVIRGIQPVTAFREASYTTQFSRKLFDKLVSPLTSVEQ